MEEKCRKKKEKEIEKNALNFVNLQKNKERYHSIIAT